VDSIAPGHITLAETGTCLGCRIRISGRQAITKTLEAVRGRRVLVNRPSKQTRHSSIIEVENFSTTVMDWVIAGLEVANAWNNGIGVRVADRITVLGNHMHNDFRTGIFSAFFNDVLIQGNETTTAGSMASTRATAG
jgi:hypothetical protein